MYEVVNIVLLLDFLLLPLPFLGSLKHLTVFLHNLPPLVKNYCWALCLWHCRQRNGNLEQKSNGTEEIYAGDCSNLKKYKNRLNILGHLNTNNLKNSSWFEPACMACWCMHGNTKPCRHSLKLCFKFLVKAIFARKNSTIELLIVFFYLLLIT